MEKVFQDFILEVEPIRLKEPLAAALGAFKGNEAVVEFSLADAVKAAGHVCPTVTGSFLILRKALERLYPNETPVRGEIEVTVYGKPDEGVFGVMAQVFSLVTGAAPATGFKGFGPVYKRKDLLRFYSTKTDHRELRFRFKRLDMDRSVLVKFYPWNIPFPEEKAARMGALIEKVVGGSATRNERLEFQDLWTEKIQGMLAGHEMSRWLSIENK